VYSFSMVLELPPAPAAREEFGLLTVVFVARRLTYEKDCWLALARIRDITTHRIAAVAAPGGRAIPLAFLPGVPGRATADVSESD
jgi:hypothetical protein